MWGFFFQPNVIVHCAAERRPDVVDKNEEATIALNVKATQDICTIAGMNWLDIKENLLSGAATL